VVEKSSTPKRRENKGLEKRTQAFPARGESRARYVDRDMSPVC
jgi:hypothetical protein